MKNLMRKKIQCDDKSNEKKTSSVMKDLMRNKIQCDEKSNEKKDLV